MRTIFKKYLLIIILLLAAIMRIWELESIPPHLTPDEASLGYNAYSVLKTAKDEYGEFLPMVFKSFGDYKPGLYVYLTVPSVAIFGLTEIAVRVPSAIAGVLAVWVVYLIVIQFKRLKLANDKLYLELVASFLLAVNPWHIHFSRGAWEANVSLTLTLFGIYYFLKSINFSKYLISASLFFSLTLLTYQGAKFSTLIVLAILTAVFWKNVKLWFFSARDHLGASIVLGLIIIFPIIISLFQGKAGRLNVFSVFSYPRPQTYLQDFLDQGNEKVGDLTYYLYHSESLNFKRGILGRYFNHFSGRFLFFEGDYQNPRHSAPNHGMLLLFDLILLPLGLISLLREKTKITIFMLLWLLLSPLPAVLSRDQVHAVRALNMIIPLTFFSAYGISFVVSILQSTKIKLLKLVLFAFIVIIFTGSSIYYLDSYFVHLPKHDSELWEYGYKQIVEIVTPLQSNYKEIKVQQSFAQPYIYFLFYQKYDPVKYQEVAKLVESENIGDVGYITKLDNICFCPIDWSINRGDHGNLIVGDTVRIPTEDSDNPDLFNLIKEIKYLNGETAFRIIEVK